MPIYEYICKQCDHKFETLQKISEAVLIECPHCNRPALRKILSLNTFRVYGDGFYKPNKK